MIAELPVDRGASQFALAFTTPPATPLTAIPILGADATVTSTTGATGVTALESAVKAPAPKLFTARTWKVYDRPFVSPLTVVPTAVRAIPVMVRGARPTDLTTTS